MISNVGRFQLKWSLRESDQDSLLPPPPPPVHPRPINGSRAKSPSVFLFYVIARLWCHQIIAPFRTQKGRLSALGRCTSIHGDNLCYATHQTTVYCAPLRGLFEGRYGTSGVETVVAIDRQRWCSKRRKIPPPPAWRVSKGKHNSRYSKAFSSERASLERREKKGGKWKSSLASIPLVIVFSEPLSLISRDIRTESKEESIGWLQTEVKYKATKRWKEFFSPSARCENKANNCPQWFRGQRGDILQPKG